MESSNDILATRCTSSPICGSETGEPDFEEVSHVFQEASSGSNGDDDGIVESQSPDSFHDEEGNRHGESTKWVVLAFVCFVMASVAYSYDIPAALHRQFHDTMKLSELQINVLYTVYSVPNIVLPFVGGTLVDRVGASKCLPFFCLFCATGQAIFTFGARRRNVSTMILGRLVYGLGGESVYVACSTLLSEWFVGNELALVFGLSMSLCKCGSVLNNLISPVVANKKSTTTALWLGVLVNGLGLSLAMAIFLLSRRKIKTRTLDQQTSSLGEPLLPPAGELEQTTTTTTTTTNNDGSDGDLASTTHESTSSVGLSPMFWLLSLSCLVVYGCVLPFNNVASAILLERNYFQTPPPDCTLEFPHECTLGSLQDHLNPSTDTNGQTCPGKIYAPVLPTILNISTYDDDYDTNNGIVDCDLTFWSVGCTKDYCDRLRQATETAGRVMSIPYIISAVLSPILGGIVDRIGQRAILASIAPIALLAVHLTLAFSRRSSPIVPLVGQGIAYSVFGAVLWPSVPLTVDSPGVAFGIINSIQNIGLVVFPLLVAAVHDASHQRYLPNVELVFCGCAAMGILVGIQLNILDRRTGNKLNSVDGKGYTVSVHPTFDDETERSSDAARVAT